MNKEEASSNSAYLKLASTMSGKKKDTLTTSDELLSGILEMAKDGVLVIQDEEIVYANEAMIGMLGYESNELTGKLIEEIIDPLEKRFSPEKLEILNADKEGRNNFHTRFLKKDRTLINVEIGSNDFEYEGYPAVVAIVRDLTQSMTLEAQVSESETRFEALHETTPIAYFTLDAEGIIKDVNSAAEKLLGYQEGQMVSMHINSFMPEEEDNPGEQVIREALKGKTIRGVEIEMVQMDGRRIWVNATANPLAMDRDRPVEIGFMALDVHRRKIAEDRENQAKQRAELYLEVMTTDLHTFNQSTAYTLELVGTMVELPQDIDFVVNESALTVKRAARMIANVRTLITLESTPPRTVKTDIYPHFKRASNEAARDFPWKTLKIKESIKDDEFEVQGHQFLWVVFFNIMHNALLHNEENSIEMEVKATTEDYGRELRIEFTDKGPGIPDEVKERIFRRTGGSGHEAFTRGLGLTLADMVVRDLGGRIWVENRVKGDSSKGSKFVVVLPMWQEAKELPCGRETCITFYKAEHCVFCGPVFDILMDVLEEFGLSERVVKIIQVDDPDSEVKEEDLPGLPIIEICEERLVGLVVDEEVRTKIVGVMVSGCEAALQ